MSRLENLLSRLTDNYNKDPSGNISKLLAIYAGEAQELMTALETVKGSRDIDSALTNGLDRIGSNVAQERVGLADGPYRTLLKTSIRRYLSSGDANTLIEIMAAINNVDPQEVYLEEKFPAGLFMRTPLTVLEGALFNSHTYIGRFVGRARAGGVNLFIQFEGDFELEETNWQGFEFSSSPIELAYSDTEGFSDTGGSVGGGLKYYVPVVADDEGFGAVGQEGVGGFFGGIYDSAKDGED